MVLPQMPSDSQTLRPVVEPLEGAAPIGIEAYLPSSRTSLDPALEGANFAPSLFNLYEAEADSPQTQAWARSSSSALSDPSLDFFLDTIAGDGDFFGSSCFVNEACAIPASPMAVVNSSGSVLSSREDATAVLGADSTQKIDLSTTNPKHVNTRGS